MSLEGYVENVWLRREPTSLQEIADQLGIVVRSMNDAAVESIVMAASTRRIIGMHIHSVGIDLGKTAFHLVALGEAGTCPAVMVWPHGSG